MGDVQGNLSQLAQPDLLGEWVRTAGFSTNMGQSRQDGYAAIRSLSSLPPLRGDGIRALPTPPPWEGPRMGWGVGFLLSYCVNPLLPMHFALVPRFAASLALA